jgi:hypothetical protein
VVKKETDRLLPYSALHSYGAAPAIAV